MKIFRRIVITSLCVAIFVWTESYSFAQETKLTFGKSVSLEKAINLTKEKEKPLLWIDVNTSPETWHIDKDILVCSGHPIGVMRSEKQYRIN